VNETKWMKPSEWNQLNETKWPKLSEVDDKAASNKSCVYVCTREREREHYACRMCKGVVSHMWMRREMTIEQRRMSHVCVCVREREGERGRVTACVCARVRVSVCERKSARELGSVSDRECTVAYDRSWFVQRLCLCVCACAGECEREKDNYMWVRACLHWCVWSWCVPCGSGDERFRGQVAWHTFLRL